MTQLPKPSLTMMTSLNSILDSVPLHSSSRLWNLNFEIKCSIYCNLKNNFGPLSYNPAFFFLTKLTYISFWLRSRLIQWIWQLKQMSWIHDVKLFLKHRLHLQSTACEFPQHFSEGLRWTVTLFMLTKTALYIQPLLLYRQKLTQMFILQRVSFAQYFPLSDVLHVFCIFMKADVLLQLPFFSS